VTIVALIVADTYIEPWLRFGRYLLWMTVIVSLISMISYTMTFMRLGTPPSRNDSLEKINYDEQRSKKEKIIS
jgi:hypothetical protein